MSDKNYDELWCEQAIDELIKNGVDHFFISPGSRSTLLVLALAKNPQAKLFWGIDERSVAFMALGYSKCHKKPGVVICTSGTAVANLYPAVVEAFMSLVPLLLLTADRPSWQRDCGANQVIFQANIFSNHIVHSFDVSPPSPSCPTIAVIDQAIKYTTSLSGPVHINLQFEEPLRKVLETCPKNISPQKIEKFDEYFRDFLKSHQGVFVVGELLPQEEQEEILKLSQCFGWPIFADITSNMRFLSDENIIHHFDLGLINHQFTSGIDAVVKFGGRLVSKRFWQWVKDVPHLLSLSSSENALDPSGLFHHVVLDVKSFLKEFLKDAKKTDLKLCMLKERSLIISRMVAEFLAQKKDNEAYFANHLLENVKEKSNLFISSSMPIRDLNQCAGVVDQKINVFANRGASGIDGIISSAFGVSLQNPTILLIGDVAFLHDTNGLMLLSQAKHKMLIVVINNQGGGIFHMLPVAKKTEVSPWFDTPHDISLGSLCKAHGISHVKVKDEFDFANALNLFDQTLVIEVMINKEKNVRFHKDFYAKISQLNFYC